MKANAALTRLLTDRAARSDPYPIYAELRRGPPAYAERPFPSVALATYRDVSAALRNPAVFSSVAMRAADPSLLGTDPPQHTRARQIVSCAFTPERIASLQGTIASVLAKATKRIARAHVADLVAEVARPLPLAVLRALLGLDNKHQRAIEEGAAAVLAEGGERALAGETAQRLEELDRFLSDLIDRRARQPRGDLISVLLTRKGGAFTAVETKQFVRLLLAAATETTTNLIANTLLALLANADLLAHVRCERALVRAAVNETLRFDSPVQLIRRRTTGPVKVSGTLIAPNTDVLLLLGSANRDEERFADADRFDVSRSKRDHLGFGGGPHACIGAMLAVTEAVDAIDALLDAFPVQRLARPVAEVPRSAGWHVRGVKELLVEVSR